MALSALRSLTPRVILINNALLATGVDYFWWRLPADSPDHQAGLRAYQEGLQRL
jgi:hypothetical protein